MRFRLVPKSSTLGDLERPICTPFLLLYLRKFWK